MSEQSCVANTQPDGPSSIQPVLALHCSGAEGRQWRHLAEALGPRFRVTAPSLIGSGDAGIWCGTHAFTLMDEARAMVDLVDSIDRPVHLVGHSYGGGVALKIASERPERVASMALYEPSAFHVLRRAGSDARDELAEIERLARCVGEGVVSGAYRQAAESFVDYWNGDGAWSSLRPDLRDALVTWLPKAPLDFRALIEDDTPPERLSVISCPVLLMCGEHARRPSRRICDHLARTLPRAQMEVIDGAGHMGPFTHCAVVNDRIGEHLRTLIRGREGERVPRALAA